MVFQSYAIWPHMNVFENIAFPLREKRMPAAEIRERVMTMLQSLGLEGLHDRPAPLLSGGQQQRVALGRALVGDPDVLLLDEPFSNLDARRRDEMRFELKEVQARVGVTTIFITHDQGEAMILSDRVVVMNAGRIVQEGTPRQIYQEPCTAFVMEFLGQVDHVQARVARRPDGAYVARADGVDVAVRFRWPRTGLAGGRGRRAVVPLHRRPGRRRRRSTAWRGTSCRGLPGRTHGVRRGRWRARVRASGPAIEPLDRGTVVQLQIPASAIRAWPAARSAERHQGGSP